MELLKEVANISGKPGLFKILKPSRTGVIVESLDSKKKREMIGSQAKVSVLKEISIYTTTADDSVSLAEVFKAIHEVHAENLEIDPKKASEKELYEFLGCVLPEFDQDRVYPSDVKKLVSWYKILCEFFPEVFEPAEEKEE